MRFLSKTCAALASASALAAAPGPLASQELDRLEVTAARLPPSPSRRAFAYTGLDKVALETAPQTRLDDILRRVPGVGLFRRASSRVAHPTTQGITLRGIGPNGAGRTLVLLDGIPLNDPFGGWVYWSALDAAALDRIDVVKGGGAGPWGNGALAGTIELISAANADTGFSGSFRGGAFETFESSGAGAVAFGGVTVSARAAGHRSDGYFLIGPDQRGQADIPADSDAWSVSGAIEALVTRRTRLKLSAGLFEENRVNGLVDATNRTEARNVSVSLLHMGGADHPTWRLNAYWQDRDFENQFVAVDDLRATTRPVLDQFDVPATGYGANGLVRLPIAGDTLEFGADLRRLEGETNERFRNLGAGFTRLRQAGGDQLLIGGYAEYVTERLPGVTLTGGLRIDYWRTFDGARIESDLADGAALREDAIADRSGTVVNGRLGATAALTGAITLRGSAYSGFRLPTINEFFRPFRVGNDITEANPELTPERLYGLEFGATYEPLNSVKLTAGYFRNWLEDGVGNVTIAFGPGFFPPTGFVPAGGVLRQRRNIERITADGLELDAELSLANGIDLEFRYLFVNARVTRAVVAPELLGRRVAQSPKHQLFAGATWRPREDLTLHLEGRYAARQFDDDLNTRVLDDYVLVNLSAAWAATGWAELFVNAENVFDTRVETAVSGAGLVTLGQPALWLLGIRLRG